MKQRAIFRAAKWLVPLALVLAACGDSETVRSGDGPTPTESSTTEPIDTEPDDLNEIDTTDDSSTDDGPSNDSSSSDKASSDKAEANDNRKPKVDSRPSTSAFLATAGDVLVPEGEPDKLSVVVTGTPQRGTLPVIVRNRSSETLYNIEVSGTARTAAGDLVGSGRSLEFFPGVVEPGEWAFGSVYFGSESLPADGQFDLTVSGDTKPGFMVKVNLLPVELNYVEGSYASQIVGIVQNNLDKPLSGPASVAVACFDGTGNTLVSYHQSYTDGDHLPASGTTSFSISLFDDPECPVYVVGSSAWDR